MSTARVHPSLVLLTWVGNIFKIFVSHRKPMRNMRLVGAKVRFQPLLSLGIVQVPVAPL
jgi:hypothetical protein